MRIVLRVVLDDGPLRIVDWPAVPHVGENVELNDGRSCIVAYVYWYEDVDEPSPYVVLHRT